MRDRRLGCPAGQMWGTVLRPLPLGRRSSASPDETVLSREDARGDAHRARRSTTTSTGPAGYGLGLGLRRDGERILTGHGGSMPGFIAGVYVSPHDKVGAAVLTNSSTGRGGRADAEADRGHVAERPVAPKPWQVEEAPPAEVEPLLGIWWVEGGQVVLSWRDGKLEGRFSGIPDWKPSSVFERETADRWRTRLRPGARGGAAAEQGRLRRGHADDLGRLPGHARAAGVRVGERAGAGDGRGGDRAAARDRDRGAEAGRRCVLRASSLPQGDRGRGLRARRPDLRGRGCASSSDSTAASRACSSRRSTRTNERRKARVRLGAAVRAARAARDRTAAVRTRRDERAHQP